MDAQVAAMRAFCTRSGPAQELPKVATKTLTATTDALGKFRFENVPPGTYWLTAKKVGYGDGKYPEKGGDGSMRLSSGQELKQADFHLVPHATLSGRVLDEDGEPYPSAMVSALTYHFGSGRRRMAPVDMAQTNNKGEFSLGKIPPGHYYLCADVMRMEFGTGNEPRWSVVDRWNRAHDVPNLFIVDGSSLVTSGRQQPTATLQALAYRAAEHIGEAARRGEL
jgi:hypothetical protein